MAKVLLTIGAFVTLALSASIPHDARTPASIEGYEMLPATFSGMIGGHSYVLNGTAQVWGLELSNILFTLLTIR